MDDPKALTAEDAAKFKVIEAPFFYASQFRISLTSTDALITFQRLQPGIGPGPDGTMTDAAMVVASAVASISLHSLKDLSLLLRDVVEGLEKDYGPIVTDFSRKRGEESKKK